MIAQHRMSQHYASTSHTAAWVVSVCLVFALEGCTGRIGADGHRRSRPDEGDGLEGVTDADRLVNFGHAVGRRLTRDEVFNSIDVALNVSLDAANFSLPQDDRAIGGFRNTAAEQLLSPARISAYRSIARTVADRVDWTTLLQNHSTCKDWNEACYDDFIASIGLVLFRRPVDQPTIMRFRHLFTAAQEEGGSFATGASLIVRAMLQSPQFLYRMEFQHPNQDDNPLREVDNFELATRLSFLVWHAGPDRELLSLAESGTLKAEIAKQVQRMLNDPRSHRALNQYIEQWLNLAAISPNIPIADDMREEVYRLFKRIVWQEQGDLMQAFVSKRSEMSGALAEFYGLPKKSDAIEEYDLTPLDERIGFTTMAGVMAAHIVNPTSSIIDRGLFVLYDVLCDSVPPPEGEQLRQAIEENTVPETSGLSQRERFGRQREISLCASCHAKMDPLGLPYEVFGSAGQFLSEDEHGNPLTGSGDVALGDLNFAYQNTAQFAEGLAASQTAARCVAQKAIQHAFGRHLDEDDQSLIEKIYTKFQAGGRTYQALLIAIATDADFAVVEVAQ